MARAKSGEGGEAWFQESALFDERKSSPCLVSVPVLSKKATFTFPANRILSTLVHDTPIPAKRFSDMAMATRSAVGSKGEMVTMTTFLSDNKQWIRSVSEHWKGIQRHGDGIGVPTYIPANQEKTGGL